MFKFATPKIAKKSMIFHGDLPTYGPNQIDLGIKSAKSTPVPFETEGESILAWHPHKKIIACALSENAIAIRSISEQTWWKLDHEIMRSGGIFSLKWCLDSDILLVGTKYGICVWYVRKLGEQQQPEMWMKFIQHPTLRACQILDVCPQGKMCVSISAGERLAHVYDVIMETSSPLFCLDGTIADNVAWSPSGLHLCLSNT